jgi:hypothetical protein
MKTVFEITRWDDPNLIAKYFRARLDWMPYGGMGKSYPYNWLEGNPMDLSKHKVNHKEIMDIFWVMAPSFYPMKLTEEYFSLYSIPIPPTDFNGSILTHVSNCLVGNFNIQEGKLTIEAELSGDENVVEALWGLSTTRYVKNGELIIPEQDWFETNTPGHIGEMSTSVITSYAPYKAKQVAKIPISPFVGKRVPYLIDIGRNTIVTNFNGGFRQRRVVKNLPIYPILWNQVGSHQLGPKEIVITKIFSVKLEV